MRSYSCFFRSIGEKKYWNGPDVLVVEVGSVMLLSEGLPMPLMAVFGTNGFQKKSEGAQGIAATAKIPGGPSRSSQKINDGRNTRVVAAAIAKEPDRFS